FSRLEKGSRTMPLVVGQVGPGIDEAGTLLRPHFGQAGLARRLEVEPDLPSVRFERDALLQVLFNLVDNAVKYANQSACPEIVLRAARNGDPGVVAGRGHPHGGPT